MNSPTFKFICGLLILGLFVGCSSSRPAASPTIQTSTATLTLPSAADFRWHKRKRDEVAPGFELQVALPEDEKLSGSFRVGFDGILKLPYDISINTEGMSEAQLKEKIIQGYSKYYTSSQNMQMSVVDRKYWVDVRGLVKNPGQYLVRETSSLDELITAAGGLQVDGSFEPLSKYVRIHQLKETCFINMADYYSGVENLDPIWRGGEVVFFQKERGNGVTLTGSEENYIRALGQVRFPGEYQFKEGGDFYYYLVKAGGPSDRADLNNLEIVRRVAGQSISIPFQLESGEPLPTLQGGDVIIVHADGTSLIEKRTKIISEIATIFTSIATVIILAIAI